MKNIIDFYPWSAWWTPSGRCRGPQSLRAHRSCSSRRKVSRRPWSCAARELMIFWCWFNVGKKEFFNLGKQNLHCIHLLRGATCLQFIRLSPARSRRFRHAHSHWHTAGSGGWDSPVSIEQPEKKYWNFSTTIKLRILDMTWCKWLVVPLPEIELLFGDNHHM